MVLVSIEHFSNSSKKADFEPHFYLQSGGPVIGSDNKIFGVVEGIVPVAHDDKRIAGAASFLPHFQVRAFIDYAEKIMLEQIVPKSLFDKVVGLKDGKGLHDNEMTFEDNSENVESYSNSLDEDFATMIEAMKKTHRPEQVEAILATIEREREEVMEILKRDGGDIDEVIAEVRARTREEQYRILEEINEQIEEAEISDGTKST